MINKKMPIGYVVENYPETIRVFEQHGLGCIGCKAALFENIEEGAKIHGIDVMVLMNDLNREVLKNL